MARRLDERTVEAWVPRDRGEVRGLLAGLDLVEPGVVSADRWHPDGPHGQVPPMPSPGDECIDPLCAGVRIDGVWVGVGCSS
jgi:hypothetical protein